MLNGRVLVASLAFAPCMGHVGPSFGSSASVQIRGGRGGGDGCSPSLVYQAVWMRLLLRAQNTVISGKATPFNTAERERKIKKYHGENRPGQCVWQSQPSVVLEGYSPLWQGRCWARWLSPVKLPAWPCIWSQSVIFLKNLV